MEVKTVDEKYFVLKVLDIEDLEGGDCELQELKPLSV